MQKEATPYTDEDVTSEFDFDEDDSIDPTSDDELSCNKSNS